jgi:flavin reductase (DIM6/NTAB) family NADH-FMN oxidoreductase RutF
MSGPAGPPAPEPGHFRSAMGRWATGVSVVTAHADGADAGLTVNALLSVSLEPPSLLVSLQRDVDTLPVLRRSGTFAVGILAASQRALSDRFARPVPSREKFEGLRVHRGSTGAPLLDDALVTLECRLVSATEQFDHVLVVGRVERIEEGPDAGPLLFFRGAYAQDDGTGRLTLGRRSGEPSR